MNFISDVDRRAVDEELKEILNRRHLIETREQLRRYLCEHDPAPTLREAIDIVRMFKEEGYVEV